MGHSSGAVDLVIKASPVPAGTVEACCYEQDDQQGDEQATPNDGGSDGPDQRPLGHVDQGGLESHSCPACSSSVLRRVPGQVDPLHTQGADQTRPLVAQLVEGMFAVVAAHTAPTWRGAHTSHVCVVTVTEQHTNPVYQQTYQRHRTGES